MRIMSNEFVEPSSNTLGQLPPLPGATTFPVRAGSRVFQFI
jgi:hypothetical protein